MAESLEPICSSSSSEASEPLAGSGTSCWVSSWWLLLEGEDGVGLVGRRLRGGRLPLVVHPCTSSLPLMAACRLPRAMVHIEMNTDSSSSQASSSAIKLEGGVHLARNPQFKIQTMTPSELQSPAKGTMETIASFSWPKQWRRLS